MHVYYVEQNIVWDTELHHFYDNTYDEDFDFTVDSYVFRATNIQDHENSLLPPGLVQIS